MPTKINGYQIEDGRVFTNLSEALDQEYMNSMMKAVLRNLIAYDQDDKELQNSILASFGENDYFLLRRISEDFKELALEYEMRISEALEDEQGYESDPRNVGEQVHFPLSNNDEED